MQPFRLSIKHYAIDPIKIENDDLQKKLTFYDEENSILNVNTKRSLSVNSFQKVIFIFR